MLQAPEDMGKDSAAPTDSHSTLIITQPSSSKPQKKKSRRKQRKDSGPTKPIQDEVTNKEPNIYPFMYPPQRVRSRSQLTELMSLKHQSTREEINDEEMLFDVQDDLQGEEVVAKKEVIEKEVSAVDPVTTAGEVVTTANVEVTTASAPTTTIDKLTLAQTLIEIKAAKPKAVTTAATTTTTTRPKARGVAKDKGKAIMVEPEKPSKKKDQIALDEELALRLHAKEQAKLERMQKERVAQEEASRVVIIDERDSIQAMIKADEQLAARLS
ncbi:hypothetical protein Tco_0340950 [Tanacetum coccineum]